MEYVNGMPIDRYCKENRLSIEQRLNLFLHVCLAIQFAHRKLVVHRDLKPSNILVREDGTIKLLDFGIANVLNPGNPGQDPLTITQTGILPLTPAYASPEQIRGDTVTTSSDIYQLGVVLYELLSGIRPYEVSGLTPSEIEHIICEENPILPSTAVTQITVDQLQHDEAEPLVEAAIALGHQNIDTWPQDLARALFLQSDIYRLNGNVQQAKELLLEAESMIEGME